MTPRAWIYGPFVLLATLAASEARAEDHAETEVPDPSPLVASGRQHSKPVTSTARANRWPRRYSGP
jgi:hypothetical protein